MKNLEENSAYIEFNFSEPWYNSSKDSQVTLIECYSGKTKYYIIDNDNDLRAICAFRELPEAIAYLENNKYERGLRSA